MKYPCTKSCQIQHLIIGDLLKLSRLWNLTRVCSVYTIHIRIDLAGICMECCCQSYCCCIGTASSQSSIIIIFIDSLKTGDNYNFPVFQLSFNTFCINSFQSCIPMGTGSMHGNLKSIQGYSGNSQFVQCHSHQCHRHLLSDGKKHIHLSFRRFLIYILCHSDQFICIFSHCRQNYHHIVSLPVLFNTAGSHIENTFFICNRSSAKFLDNQHCFLLPPLSLYQSFTLIFARTLSPSFSAFTQNSPCVMSVVIKAHSSGS